MRTHTLILAAIAALGLAACDSGSADQTVSLAPEGFAIEPTGQDEVLPAWQTSGERTAAKADEFDLRGEYGDIFGVTAAPAGGARAVAEFEPTDGVLIAWSDGLSAFFVDLVLAVAARADVYLVTPSLSTSETLRDYFESQQGVPAGRITFFEYPHDAFWSRDFGPFAIEQADGTPAFVDARYYNNRRRDDAVPTLLGRYLGVPVYRPNLITEGGNFMTNGEGLCVATEWLLAENSQISQQELAAIQADYLGCERTIILTRMAGEGTGHVDMFAKFTSRDTVLVGAYDHDEDRVNAAILDANAQRLASEVLPDGTPLRVVRIPMPSATGGVFRSYTNSLIVNGAVIMPTYDTDSWREADAIAAYQAALPAGYQVVPVDSSLIIDYGGAVHCTTMSFNTTAFGTDAPNHTVPDGGTVEPPVTEPAPEGVSYESSPALAIPDLSQAVDQIVVEAEGDVAGPVTVAVQIQHSYVGDLAIFLEHEGLWAELYRFGGGAATSLEQTWQIQGFEGVARAGAWRLVVEDHAAQDVGTLDHWTRTRP